MSKIKLKFDPITHAPEMPTIILANKNGDKLGEIIAKNVIVKDSMVNPSEISFSVNKYENNIKNHLWDRIVNFRLVLCKEWNTWFEISVEIDETNKTIKHVSGIELGKAELSKIKLFNVEINTEKDIARDDYEIAILFDKDNPKKSLLHRILEKAPHYHIAHVDASIAKLQRAFTFDDISIDDAFMEIAEEIGCIFIYETYINKEGIIIRDISVYDLQHNCIDCEYRGEFTDKCPKCNSVNITDGYGEDTSIFITSNEIANDLKLTTDTDAVNNCFKLEAGDDLMTATIRNCNPNGSDYIWYISDDMKEIMPDELVNKINQYDELFDYYQKNHHISIDDALLKKYNDIILKYKAYNQNLEQINIPIIGYPRLMTAYYNTIDLALYLKSILMPDAKLNDTSAEEQGNLLTSKNLSPISVSNIKYISISTANNAVLSFAKSIVDPRYQVKINTSSMSNLTWKGSFIVTNYSDEEDTTTTSDITVTINDNYEKYVKHQIDKLLSKEAHDLSISGLFKMTHNLFCEELKKYCLDSLNSFYNICQSCIDILIEQGIANRETWADKTPSLYDELYLPYRNKLDAIQSEIAIRENEVETITGTSNDNNVISHGIQTYIIEAKQQIQDNLNFEKYLGKELWLDFYAYRREDKYSNSNYISDGLNNTELFNRALEFLETASKEIYKSSTLQHSISSNLKNIFAIKKFKPLYDHFEIGNWLRVQIDDKIYKLRLIEYEIDYDNLANLSTVDFSDVLRIIGGISDSKSIFDKASSITSSYDYVQRQAEQGSKSQEVVNKWVQNGLDVTKTKILSGSDGQTQTWDEHGFLLRKYDEITDSYHDEQMRFLNNSILITNDNWENVKTAIGGYYYYEPSTNELKYTYGVNAETLIGNLILGENLGIYSDDNSLTFDKNGLKITNDKNTFIVNPNSSTLLSLSNKNGSILSVDENGVLHLKGDGTELDDYKIIDKINKSNEEVSIKAEKIKLEGLVTANENFKILSDGSLQAKNGKFSGNITGTNISGSSGEFTKSFNVSVPVSINGDNFKWVMSSNPTEGVFIGTQYYGDDPLFTSSIMTFNTDGVKISTTGRGTIKLITQRGGVNIEGDLNVSGSKSRIINTRSYDNRLLYCYETTSPYFGDIGHGIIGDDGFCYIDIDCIFSETVDTIQNYNVFLQSYSNDQIYVYQKECNYFIVKGIPNTEFDWEIKAKQADYSFERLEEIISSDNDLEIDYIEQADNYLKSYEKELIENE